jgi:hypothetical protein
MYTVHNCLAYTSSMKFWSAIWAINMCNTFYFIQKQVFCLKQTNVQVLQLVVC